MRFRYPAKTNDAKDLVLAQASYCYQTTDGKPQRMLFNLSTTFKAGQKYAIVGKAAQASQHYSVC